MLPFLIAAINPDPELRVIPLTALGIQEPASTVFSLLGGLMHTANLLAYMRASKRRMTPYPYDLCLKLYHYTWAFTCYSAFLFHWHETKLNEACDYYGVLAAVYVGLWYGILRCFSIKPTSLLSGLIAAPLLFIVLHTIHYMTFVLFDYGYHNKVCAFAIAFHAIFWTAVWVRTGGKGKSVYFVYAHVLLGVCSSFELFDFTPLLGTFDGHSLWHLAALPAGFLLFEAFMADAR
jgi:hypothetical protein